MTQQRQDALNEAYEILAVSAWDFAGIPQEYRFQVRRAMEHLERVYTLESSGQIDQEYFV